MLSAAHKTGPGVPNLGSILRSLVVWLLIITAESFNGTLRQFMTVPVLGEVRARLVSFGIALVLILLITAASIKWIGTNNGYRLLLIGILWAVLTFCFEFVLGVVVFEQPWARFKSDYDIASGGLMPFGLLFLTFAPLLGDRLGKQKLQIDNRDP